MQKESITIWHRFYDTNKGISGSFLDIDVMCHCHFILNKYSLITFQNFRTQSKGDTIFAVRATKIVSYTTPWCSRSERMYYWTIICWVFTFKENVCCCNISRPFIKIAVHELFEIHAFHFNETFCCLNT